MKNISLFLTPLFISSALMSATVSTDKTSYTTAEAITVSVGALPTPENCPTNIADEPNKAQNDCNWVGLFYAYDTSEPINLIDYRYIRGNQNQNVQFPNLAFNGEYEARVYANNSYIEEATVNFKVQSQQQELTLKTIKDSYEVNEPITVSLSGLPGNDEDWVGIFYAFDESEAKNLLYKVKTAGKTSGTFTLPALDEESEYEVRVFFNGTFNEESYYPFTVINQPHASDVIINEVMAKNSHTILDPDYSKFSDWIELYNTSNKIVDISGYKLGTKTDEASWTIPSGTTIDANGYLLIWADKKDTSKSEHHTNFKLKSKKGTVAFFDDNGQLIDALTYQQQAADISAVNTASGVAYAKATPKKQNEGVLASLTLSDRPTVSKSGGFYDSSIPVTLTGSGTIYYTLDGSYPTSKSKRYNSTIRINKTKTLKAIAIEDGKFASPILTNTYFINEEISLPVVSISTDQRYISDDMVGIYVRGQNGAYLENCDERRANFYQDWERPAFIEYYDDAHQLAFAQDVEIKLSGRCSRELAQKSLSIKADDVHGEDLFDYKIFSDKDLTTFKSFKLRSSGQDWYKTMFRDAMIQELIKNQLDIDYQAYQPTILFINGRYWGIHNIREKKNGDYIANNHPGVDADTVNILYAAKEKYTKQGSADEYYDGIIDYLKENDPSDAETYAHIESQMDISNYIDYMITQIYVDNNDWPNTNIRYWKEPGKGKWRWMMDDQDYGFNLYEEDSIKGDSDSFGPYHDTLAFATAEHSDSYRNTSYSTFLLRSLLDNATFRNRFNNRYIELLGTTFATDRVLGIINTMANKIAPEIERHTDKWGDDSGLYNEDWNNNVDIMREFARIRPALAREHLNNKMSKY